MSCIPKILEMKGDKPILEVLTMDGSFFDLPILIEGGGQYKKFDYLITFTPKGHRCGYVAIPADYPKIKCTEYGYPDYNFRVHGDVTFYDKSHIEEDLLGDKSCDDMWIGFDAAHSDDLPDWEKYAEYYGETEYMKFMNGFDKLVNDEYGMAIKRGTQRMAPTIKTYEYMEEQCKNLIEQLIKRK